MNFHEYQAKALFAEYGIPVPRGELATTADEAVAIGLADRRVAPGQALPAALELARGLTRFPQGCMRADHLSARLSPRALAAALTREWASLGTFEQEGIAGAARFAAGAGRSGRFDGT